MFLVRLSVGACELLGVSVSGIRGFDLSRQVAGLELLFDVGLSLTSERDHDRLIEKILIAAKQFCRADGGTIYLATEDDHLEFAIMRNDTMGTALGGTTGKPLDQIPRVPLKDPVSGEPNERNIAAYAANTKQSVNIEDAYEVETFDFSGTKEFDRRNGYRSQSFLTIPMLNNSGRLIGVLQLINAQDPDSGEIVTFDGHLQQIVEALASQAAVALDNQHLLAAQRKLMESFIQLIAEAIDAKSPYTGGHCERVPIITEMITEAVCQADSGPFADFDLTSEQWYELRIAAWLHDCGKIITPVHVMDKATKLESIRDGIETVRARFEALKRETELEHLRSGGAGDDPALAAALGELDDDLAFLERSNVGGEFLADEHKQRIRSIARRTWRRGDSQQPLLSAEETDLLCISRGTLSEEERLVINGHMVQTVRMLERLPFPQDLKRVPEYAGGHHETMDGKGYPKGIFAGDMSIPARIMAIADVFEALTAPDRPYKRGKSLSETMAIMGRMKENNHLDPLLFDFFVQSGVYRQYAERYMDPELVDEVDEKALLEITPKAFDPPPEQERAERWKHFLPKYHKLVRSALGDLAAK
ncbi:MAG: GAF domain-containing protein [Gammaproteobacteria bacterium]|nr:GAF domain-containing protein [Gammaproteobacteria bacterium]